MKITLSYYFVAFCLLSFLMSCKTRAVYLQTNATPEVNYIPYYLTVYKADSLFKVENYQNSYRILDSLFKIYQPLNMQNYNEYGVYIASCVMSGHNKNILEKIKLGFARYGTISFSHRNSQTIYDSIIKVSGITEDKAELYKEEYIKKINLALRKRIQKMEEEDQSARTNYDEQKMSFFQKKHQIEIEEIIAKYGYPNEQVIGFVGYRERKDTIVTPFQFKTIFLHQDPEIQKKYLPKLLLDVKHGKLTPAEYASIYDKSILVITDKNRIPKQLYGSFSDTPLLCEKKIDSIRKSIGLPRFGYEKWSYDQAFNN